MSLGRKDLGSPGDNSCAFPCSHCPRRALTRPHAETVARTSRVPVSDSPATHLTTHQPCVIPTKPPAPGKKMSTPLRENLKAGPPQGRPHPRDGDHFSQKPHLCAQIGAATGEARASHGGQKWLRVTSEARPPGMTLLCPAPWDTQAVSHQPRIWPPRATCASHAATPRPPSQLPGGPSKRRLQTWE